VGTSTRNTPAVRIDAAAIGFLLDRWRVGAGAVGPSRRPGVASALEVGSDDAAVDLVDGPGDVAGPLRRQEGHQLPDLGRLTQAAQRDPCGDRAWMVVSSKFRVTTSKPWRQSSSVRLGNFPGAGPPELLTRTSTPPKRSTVAATTRWMLSGVLRSALTASIVGAGLGADLLGRCRKLLLAPRTDRHPGALAGQGERRRLAQALAGRRDHRDLAAKSRTTRPPPSECRRCESNPPAAGAIRPLGSLRYRTWSCRRPPSISSAVEDSLAALQRAQRFHVERINLPRPTGHIAKGNP
jgi:hypothetical protein